MFWQLATHELLAKSVAHCHHCCALPAYTVYNEEYVSQSDIDKINNNTPKYAKLPKLRVREGYF